MATTFRRGDRVRLTEAALATSKGPADTGTVRNSPNPTALYVRIVWDRHGSRTGRTYPRDLIQLVDTAESGADGDREQCVPIHGEMPMPTITTRPPSPAAPILTTVPDEDRDLRRLRSVAYHEAGHAVAALELGRSIKYVSIVPTEDRLGVVHQNALPAWFKPDRSSDGRHRRLIEREVLIDLAGIAAEHRFSGRNNWRGAGSDFHQAIELASYLYHGKVLEKYMAFMVERVRTMVAGPRFWVQVEALAEELLKQRQLSAKRVREICRSAVLTAVASRASSNRAGGGRRS
jgi:Peptidase family M41